MIFGPSRKTIRDAVLDAHYEIEYQKTKPLRRERIETAWKPEMPQYIGICRHIPTAAKCYEANELPPQAAIYQKIEVPIYRKVRVKFIDWLERVDGKLTGRVLFTECEVER